MELSAEQKRRIEENKRRALERRQSHEKPSASRVVVLPDPFANRADALRIPTGRPQDSRDPALSRRKERLPRSPRQQTNTKGTPTKRRSDYGSGERIGSPQKRSRFSRGGGSTHDPVKVKAICSLITRSRFEVRSPFHRGLVELFKTMKSQCYEPVARTWNFDLSDYNSFVQKVHNLHEIECEPLHSAVLTTFAGPLRGESSDNSTVTNDLSRVESSLVNALMMFQHDGVNFGINHDGRVLIADDMGLGKTVQAICLAAYYRSNWPLLIVAPSSVRFTWQDQLRRWLSSSLSSEDIHVITGGKNFELSTPIVIISYDLMSRNTEALLNRGFNMVIMDESHFLKNSKTARTKAAIPILKRARRVLLLSGTPALSRPSELFSQISCVDPAIFRSFHDFGVRYCAARKLPWGWDYSGCSNMTELQLILEERIMIRRTKAKVLHQLPAKRREMIILDPELIKKGSLSKHAKNMLQPELKGMEKRAALLQYFNDTGKVKVHAVTQYINDLLESGEKFLVFAHHSQMLNALEKELIEKGVGYIRIDGSTPSEGRRVRCDNFQLDETIKVALLSITAASQGINLTAGSLVVFAELFWNPGILVQAEDRVYRIGQKNSVNIRYLVAEGTADDYIWPLVQTKLEVLGKAGLNQEDFRNADTTRLQSKEVDSQKTIMDFFREDFIEETDHNDKEEVRTAADKTEDKVGTKLKEAESRTSNNLDGEDFSWVLEAADDDFSSEQKEKNSSKDRDTREVVEDHMAEDFSWMLADDEEEGWCLDSGPKSSPAKKSGVLDTSFTFIPETP